jgi:hypothetical protein
MRVFSQLLLELKKAGGFEVSVSLEGLPRVEPTPSSALSGPFSRKREKGKRKGVLML